RARTAVLRARGREILAAEDLAAELEEKIERRHPAQLHAVVAVLIAEERLVSERPVDEVVGMRVVAVEIADVRVEPAGAHVEALGKGQRIDVRLFDVRADLAVVVVIADRELAIEFIVDVGGERDLALAQREALRTRAETVDDRESRSPRI